MVKSKANDNVSVTNIMPFRNGQKINKNNEISFEKGAKIRLILLPYFCLQRIVL